MGAAPRPGDGDPSDLGRGRRARPRRETPAEARARRAAVEDPDAVLAAAARLLESRQRTVAEVRRRLADAGYRHALVEATVTRLVELGYLDDEEFARAWVASRDRAHPRGERALRVELARKGVAREIVDEVLAERDAAAADGPDRITRPPGAPGGDADGSGAGEDGTRVASADDEAAARLLERRGSTLARITDPRERRRRAYALLARAGFDPATSADVAARFVRQALEE